jgi:hypothetical protein
LTAEILKLIRKELPSHLVYIDRAHLDPGQSITIEGIRIAKPTDQGLRDVVRCGRLVCSGPIELIGLIQGQTPVQKVVADGFELCMWPMSDGRFSIQELASPKPISPHLPSIEIRSGLIRLGSETGLAEQEIICHDLRAHVGLAPRMVDGLVKPLAANIGMSVSSSYFNQITINGTISEDKKSWNAQGRINKLEYSQRLADQLPSVYRQYLNHASGFNGVVNSVFSILCDRGNMSYEAKANISQGRLMHPKVPFPLDALSADLYCKNGLMQLTNVHASSGQASLSLACNMMGFHFGAPLAATIDVRDLTLDQRLYQALPAAMQETWRKLGVSGVVDAQATVRFDGQRWSPNVSVRAKNAGLEPDVFPYPIRQVTGDFLYANGTLTANNLTGVAGDQKINGALVLTQAQPRWLMDLKLAADGPIAIDENLLRALTPKDTPESGLHKFVLSLHPTGTVLLKQGHFFRTAENPETVSRSLELTFSECSIKYDSFRYPIVDVHGEVILDNETLLLKDFVGRNDGARLKGQGNCRFRNSAVDSMELYFDGYDVGLDEELQQALPRSVRGLWDQLQPSGVLDQVAVEIRRASANDPLGRSDMRVAIKEDRDPESHAGRSVSIRPVSLPYQVNDVSCDIVYRPGLVEINSLEGLHEASRLQTHGQCKLNTDGTWEGWLTWLPNTRLIVDQSLLNCLPIYLREPLARLDFHGPVSITGKTRVSSPPSANESIVRDWDVELQIEDGRLGGGGIASGIRGSIALAGENTPQGPLACGKLMLDALAIKNIPMTLVRGPFAFNQQELLFGRDATAWQQKNNLRSPNFNQTERDNPVSTAGYLVPRNNSGFSDPSVSQASFRSNLQDSLAGNGPIASRGKSEPPVDPNAIRTTEGIPQLDTKDNDIVAHTLSGTMFLSGVEPLRGQQRGSYRVRLVDADLQGCLVDLGETNAQATGSLSIQCDLQGSLTNTAALEGKGQVWLRKANLYELPAMIRIFRMLSVSPGQGAFDSADAKFRIDGESIPVEELNLDGDIVSMQGSGWVNMRRELHLDLFAHVGRRNLVGAIFRPIANSKAARLWQIEVSGTTSDPQIHRPMPLMNSLDKALPVGDEVSNTR